MATIVYFDGQFVTEPGAYSKVRSLVPVPPVDGTFGNVVIIDTGSGSAIGGYGSGINGTLKNGVDSVYQFLDPASMRAGIRGGQLWDMANYLFSPSPNQSGAASVFYIRACTTAPAALTLTFLSALATPAGAVTIKANNEGTGGNGAVVTNTSSVQVTTRGYSAKIRAGVINAAAIIIDFFEGQYRGQDENGYEMDTPENQLQPVNVVWSSGEVTTCNQFISVMNTDPNFSNLFTLGVTTPSAVAFTAYTITHPAGYQLFAGGTTVYNATDVDNALTAIQDLDNSLFICDGWGSSITGAQGGAQSVANQKIMAHIMSDANYKQKIMFIGGGDNKADFTNGTDGSVETAAYYNNPLVVVVHSGIKVPVSSTTSSPTPYTTRSSFFHAAMACGLTAGLQPQVPATYKAVRILGLKHVMTKPQRVQALQAGVWHVKKQKTLGWVVNQSINTMQQNTAMYYPAGTSPEVSIMRIIHELNKELRINGEPLFTGQNQNLASDTDVIAFTEGYLTGKIATKLEDNYIIKFSNVTTVLTAGSWDTKYCFVPNGPINKEFWTGYIVDPNVTTTPTA